MAAKKNGVKYDFTKGEVAAQIERDINATFAGAKSVWTIAYGYIKLNAEGKLPASEAKRLLVARRNALQKKYDANHDGRKVADIKDSRVSEMAGILRLGEWKCWPTAMAHIKDLDVNLDTINTLSKVVRSEVKGAELKKSADSCPARELILRKIKERKKSRRGSGGTANGNKAFTAAQTETALERMIKSISRVAKWFGSEKKPMVAALRKQAETVAREAKALAKKREKEAEAAEAA